MRNIYILVLLVLITFQGAFAADPVLQLINVSPDRDMDYVRVELGDSVLVDSLAFNGATAYLEVQVTSGDTLTFTSVSEASNFFQLTGVTTEADKRYQSILYGVSNVNSYALNPDGIPRDLGATWETVDASGVAVGNIRVNFFHAVADAIELDVADLLLEYIVDDMAFTSYSATSTDFVANTRSIFFVSTDSTTQIASRSIDLSLLTGPTATIFLSGFIVPSSNLSGPSLKFFIADSDGTVTPLSLLLAVPFSELAANVNIYPNPATEWLRVDLTTTLPGSIGIALIDITGKQYTSRVYEAVPGQNAIALDLPVLAKGLYFLRLDNGEQSVAYPVVISQ